MADVRISALPTAQSPITGDELVPIVQNGLTVQTTVNAITQSPSLTQTFLTVGQQPQLPNSRYIATGTGLGFTDNGAQNPYIIALNGTSASLEGASAGVIVKTAPNTIAARALSTSGNGISVTNGDGVSGNPTFQLTGVAQAIANASGTGLLAIGAGSTITPVTITGVSDEISVTGGNGSTTPLIGLANNPILPGNASVRIPSGTTAERGLGVDGDFRFNTDSGTYEAYALGVWRELSLSGGVLSFSAGTTGFSPNSNTSGAVTLSGILNSTSGGTGASALTGYLYGNGASPATASTTIPTTNLSGTISNAQLANSSLTVNGQSISLGGTGTITAANPSVLTIGTGLSGASYDGSAPVVIALSDTGILGGTFGTAARTITQIVNPQGQITSIFDQAIDGIALTSGTISTSPTVSTDLVNKSYVDGLVATGLIYHQPVQAATTASLASITGGTVTYNNGTSGVGATLTLSSALTILDGYTLLNTNRILVKDEANQAHNGIYTWATGGTVLTRATDADSYGSTPDELSQNDYFFVQNGTVNKGISYVISTTGVIIFGTTAITFSEFSTSQVYTAGTGLTLSGTQFSLTVPVVEANGGTGQTSYTTGDLLVASGSTSLSKLADVATGNALISGGVGAAPTYGKIGLTTHVDGVLPIANGGTNATNAADALTSLGAYPATNPSGYTSNTGTVTSVSATAGTGISISGSPITSSGTLTVTNTAPDQVVGLTGAGTTTISGTYPNFTVTSNDQYSGTVTSVGGTGTVNGITLTGTVTSSGNLTLGGTLSGVNLSTQVTGTLPVANGGTGQTTYTDGQLLIGNTTGNTLTPATLTAGSGISITNGSGAITIASTSGGGSVTSVDVSGGTTGLTTSGGPITGSGTITLAGTLGVANGGTGATTLTGVLKGNGTSAVTASNVNLASEVTGTLPIANGGTGATSAGAALTSLGAYPATNPNGYTSNTGTVTSVAATVPSFLSVSGSPITTSGTLALSYSGTALPIANGGTNATSAAAALTSLGAYPATNPNGYTTNTGTVTSVGGTGTVNGISLSGTVTTSGSLTLGGTLSGVNLASQVTGTLPIANGGTGQTTLAAASIVTYTGTATLTNKTLTDPAIIGTILEDVFTITDGAAFEIDPSNGSIQLITLGANRTPKATNFAAGEAITLMVDDGTAYAITWTDATWGGTGVIWETDAGVAPTLSTTGYTTIVLWKVSTQVYGARVGNA